MKTVIARLGALLMWAVMLQLLPGCKLTSTDVEPELPAGQVNNSSTLVYRANGVPIVANNSVNIGTFIVAIFADPRAVAAKLSADSTLTLRSVDANNQPTGYATHALLLEVKKFYGAGTYAINAASGPYGYTATYYQVTTYTSEGNPIDHATQYPVASRPGQLVITKWEPGTRHIQGTFALPVAGRNNVQNPTEITEGRFDVEID